MTIGCAPDIAEQCLETVSEGLEHVQGHIDDVAVFGNSWREHLEHVKTVLDHLQTHGCTVNPMKCELAIQETDFWDIG